MMINKVWLINIEMPEDMENHLVSADKPEIIDLQELLKITYKSEKIYFKNVKYKHLENVGNNHYCYTFKCDNSYIKIDVLLMEVVTFRQQKAI